MTRKLKVGDRIRYKEWSGPAAGSIQEGVVRLVRKHPYYKGDVVALEGPVLSNSADSGISGRYRVISGRIALKYRVAEPVVDEEYESMLI